jgi:hypothetical protein
MNVFEPPKGLNFHLGKGSVDASSLSQALVKVVAYLQNRTAGSKLIKYTDWWEHNGLHFIKDEISFGILASMIDNPRRILESMPGVDSVFIGVSPTGCEWYLRYYLDWDDNGKSLVGKFDITVPESMHAEFEDEVVKELGFPMDKEASGEYYRRIIG